MISPKHSLDFICASRFHPCISKDFIYIAKDHSNGCVLDFTLREGAWVMDEWNCIWSDYGSASDVIWPYWWHFIYGGF